MMQNCHTQFSNGTLCNTPFMRVVSLGGVVEYYNVFGRRIDYCPQCGHELTLVELEQDDDPRAPEQIAADDWQAEYREDVRSLVLGL